MPHRHIQKMVLAAVLAALTCVATMVIQVPSPIGGYVNMGDCFVLLSGWLLGPWWGAAAGGIGTMLTDLFMGYAYWAPGSLVIKGLDAMVCALVYRAMKSRRLGAVVSGLCGEAIMIGGYFLYAALILGRGDSALLSVPGNLVQALAGIIAGLALLVIAGRAHLMDKYH